MNDEKFLEGIFLLAQHCYDDLEEPMSEDRAPYLAEPFVVDSGEYLTLHLRKQELRFDSVPQIQSAIEQLTQHLTESGYGDKDPLDTITGCPFCGQTIKARWNPDPGQYEFLCNACSSLVIFHNDLTDEEAAAHWNTRA